MSRSTVIKLAAFTLFFSSFQTASAIKPIFFGEESYPIYQNNIIIDEDNSGGDVGIQFGRNLSEKLFWDADGGDGFGVFNLSDNLFIDGKLGVGKDLPTSTAEIYENSDHTENNAGLTIENEGTGDSLVQFLLTSVQRWIIGVDNSDEDKFKIASSMDLASDTAFTIDTTGQVGIGTTDPDGTLDVEGNFALLPAPGAAPDNTNFTNSQWTLWLDELNNEFKLKGRKTDGTFITQTVGSGSGGSIGDTLAAVQARRDNNFTLNNYGQWYDIPLNLTDVETAPSVIEHNNSNDDRIDIKEDGTYRITYHLNGNGSCTHRMYTRIRKNDSTVLNGSTLVNRNYSYEYVPTTGTFIAELSSGDYLTLQAMRDSCNEIIEETLLTVVKLEGIQGPQGPPGEDGGGGGAEDWDDLPTRQKTIYLSPEYPGAVFQADGSNNEGTFNAGNDNFHNAYKWTVDTSDDHDYDIYIRILLPEDFESWTNSPVDFNYKTQVNNTIDNFLDFNLYDTTDTIVSLTGETGLTSNNTWQTYTSTDNINSGYTWNPGEWFTVRLHLSADEDGAAYAGEIELNYNGR